MEVLKAINLGVRFLLEIIVLVTMGYWGFHVTQSAFVKILLGIGTPLLVAVIWGMFGAPKAPYTLTGFPFLLLDILIFGLPVVVLLYLEKQTMAWFYVGIAVINNILMKVLNQ